MLKRINFLLVFISFLLFFCCRFVLAEEIEVTDASTKAISSIQNVATKSGLMNQTNTSVYTTVGSLIGYLLSATSVVLLILAVYGGITWMTAAGDDKKVDKGRQIIIQGVIGLIVSLTAYALSAYVFGKLAATGLVQ